MFTHHILSKFLDITVKFPNRNAFLINEKFYTYSEFFDRISIIRGGIRQRNSDTKIIGIIAHDNIDTYASIFAVWFEGMAYVPLHPKQPLERNLEIIEQSGITMVLDAKLQSQYDASIVLKTNEFDSSLKNTELLDISEGELAYILFTSGSTGVPKGVQITRENVAAFIVSFMKTGFEIDETDKGLQCFDLTFDVSVQCFLTPLLHGACVYTIPHDQIKYSYVYGLLDDHELTFGIFAPSMIRFLRPYFDEMDFAKMRYCILTAEASPVDLVEEWSQCIPNATIYNFYGPTEATIYCTSYKVPKNNLIKQANGMLCIGKEMFGVKAIILDSNLQKVANNIKGEMYISGAQLTKGYCANPQKTEEVFTILNLLGTDERYYKTGDLCSMDDDGDILYFGRLDYQVKIQGYRIELGEIEFTAREIIGGKNAIAFTFEGYAGNQEIAMCLETEEFDEKEFLNALKSKLPSYMIPSKIYNLKQFPVNTSGKVDRKLLNEILKH
ncbi:amino acid adenylation domain-containing protein [Flavobacterium sp.]